MASQITDYLQGNSHVFRVSLQMNCHFEGDILSSKLKMCCGKGVITNQFVADNQPTDNMSTDELLTNNILDVWKHEIPYSNCPPNYRI